MADLEQDPIIVASYLPINIPPAGFCGQETDQGSNELFKIKMEVTGKMKIKRSTKSTDRLVALLKKETIAHLSPEEMFKGITGGWQIDHAYNPLPNLEDTHSPCPVPVTTDSGLTPFCALGLT